MPDLKAGLLRRWRSSKAGSEKGIVLMMGTAALVVIIPMVGLAVDVGYLYAVKARLQAAVDGAALASARALSIGANTAAQKLSAQRNAVSWFYANFPPGSWGTTNADMQAVDARVAVYNDDDPYNSVSAPSARGAQGNPNLRHVDINTSVRVPTYFMKWFNIQNTTIKGVGHATRRDTVIMIVLDRSGSMCEPGGSPCGGAGQQARACGPMKDAAKLFTGQFAAGRDYIGLVSYSDGVYVHSAPTRDFRTVLGFNTGSVGAGQTGTGAIDSIVCNGRTNSASALSLAYNELVKVNQPGALNVLLFETDGLPNTLTMNMWDGTAYGMATSGSCTDGQSPAKTKAAGGWNTLNNGKKWLGSSTTPSYTMKGVPGNPNREGYMGNIPAGAVGAVFAADPNDTHEINSMYNPFQTNGSTGMSYISTTNTAGCKFNTTRTNREELLWLAPTDVFGNSLNPTAHTPYKTGMVMNGTRVMFGRAANGTTARSVEEDWSNFNKAAYNATDDAAYRIRSNTYPVYPSNPTNSLKPTLYVIGLGGQGNDPLDHTLLQRIANDPLPDPDGGYLACSVTPNCITYDDQPQGRYMLSADKDKLKRAFLNLSSQILRLNR